MEFEYDSVKSSSNLEKHGIDFETVKMVWADNMALEVPLMTEREDRYFVIGLIDEHLWTAVITYRENKVRIISVRRSRGKEADLYESK